GFDDFDADLSTRNPDKSMGDQELWDEATDVLRLVLEDSDLDYAVSEGEGAFYGPKIDIHVKDAIGRRWQISTIQVDFMLPGRFELEYTSPENKAERPVMIHCAKAGSIERFIGVLIEHHAGAFPMWLAPMQASVIPVADRHLDYAARVAERLGSAGLRVEVDESGETVGEKIRRALTAKHPAVLVVGDRDVEGGTVGLRMYGEDRERRGVPVDELVEELTRLAVKPS
ncbi:MAG TPA: threonine--tRNA ligase, partial [Acidimicrobiia bacterium]|nr:threonine--tRNA ligase [Acidimicrobiia bacterium]